MARTSKSNNGRKAEIERGNSQNGKGTVRKLFEKRIRKIEVRAG